jgi:hypothetical protein
MRDRQMDRKTNREKQTIEVSVKESARNRAPLPFYLTTYSQYFLFFFVENFVYIRFSFHVSRRGGIAQW